MITEDEYVLLILLILLLVETVRELGFWSVELLVQLILHLQIYFFVFVSHICHLSC